jgi:hypothetical protein
MLDTNKSKLDFIIVDVEFKIVGLERNPSIKMNLKSDFTEFKYISSGTPITVSYRCREF